MFVAMTMFFTAIVSIYLEMVLFYCIRVSNKYEIKSKNKKYHTVGKVAIARSRPIADIYMTAHVFCLMHPRQ